MTTASEWTPGELNGRLERGDEFFILDVRNRDEFEAGPIEGRKPLPQRNVPYFEMLEAAGDADFVEAFVKYARTELSSELPTDREILAVCAKGGTSEFVAQALRQLGYNAANLVGGTTAWGNHYQIKTVIDTQALQVFQVQRPGRGCLSYVVVSDRRAAVVDPLRHIAHYIELAEEQGFTINLVLDTHGHADHVSGGSALAGRLHVPYHLHPYDGIHPLDVLPARIPFEFVRDGARLRIGRAQLEVLHIPGHTLGNTALLLDGQFLFSGDSIFIRSIARPDLGGRAETWAPLHYRSLRRLLALPDDVTVLPGHFSARDEADENGIFAATLGQVRAHNEGLAMAEQAEDRFIEYILSSLPKFPPEYVDIKRVNAGLLQPDEDATAELELGKNVCALASS